ncbi:hypothetical protein HK097_003591 [Rhizophlyctis rosea]|uniref:Uncharacterized protein n=1 Tax=Rhizophlyctis rosea TaxID=64517 RepID=A0AAD5X3S8_9FUNG|nr:hypothetical protein HK097_003591 [Rhizophlyctis rosea]
MNELRSYHDQLITQPPRRGAWKKHETTAELMQTPNLKDRQAQQQFLRWRLEQLGRDFAERAAEGADGMFWEAVREVFGDGKRGGVRRKLNVREEKEVRELVERGKTHKCNFCNWSWLAQFGDECPRCAQKKKDSGLHDDFDNNESVIYVSDNDISKDATDSRYGTFADSPPPSTSSQLSGSRKKKKKRKFVPAKEESEQTLTMRQGRKEQQEEIDRRAREQLAEEEEQEVLLMSGRVGSGIDGNREEKKIIVNLGHDEGVEHILLGREFAWKVRPHQIEGIRFMWKNLIMMKHDDRGGNGPRHAGCILAHAMGLGKTMQVIALLCVLREEVRKNSTAIPEHLLANRVLIIVPPALINNWQQEITQWDRDGSLVVHDLPDTFWRRRYKAVEKWYNEGGVFLIGYEMFLSLCKRGATAKDALQPETLGEKEERVVRQWLMEGPSLVVCDEGHRLKGLNQTAVMVNQIVTPSRICLTGYPLQNNLIEYWAMVNFVAPGYLGDMQEYKNAYAIPITQGGFSDSDEMSVTQAKRCMWLLQEVLKDVVMRKDNHPLKEDIPTKTEFQIICRLAPMQRELYNAYLDSFNTDEKSNYNSILARKSAMSRICNHPWAYRQPTLDQTRKLKEKLRKESAADGAYEPGKETPRKGSNGGGPVESPDAAIPDAPSVLEEEGSDQEAERIQGATVNPPLKDVFSKFPDVTALEHSGKMEVMMLLVREAIKRKEKTLVFTRNLDTLDYMKMKMDEAGISSVVIKGDVKTSSRQALVENFSVKGNIPVFLISTRSGSVGTNLQAASRVILIDLGWNPSEDEQAIGRAYRYGQKKPVFVYRLMMGDTMEITLRKNNDFKVALAKDVVDQKNTLKLFTKNQMKHYFTRPPETQEWGMTAGDEDVIRKSEDEVMVAVCQQLKSHLIRIDPHEVQHIDEIVTETERIERGKLLEEEKLVISGKRKRIRVVPEKPVAEGNVQANVQAHMQLNLPVGAISSLGTPGGSMVNADFLQAFYRLATPGAVGQGPSRPVVVNQSVGALPVANESAPTAGMVVGAAGVAAHATPWPPSYPMPVTPQLPSHAPSPHPFGPSTPTVGPLTENATQGPSVTVNAASTQSSVSTAPAASNMLDGSTSMDGPSGVGVRSSGGTKQGGSPSSGKQKTQSGSEKLAVVGAISSNPSVPKPPLVWDNVQPSQQPVVPPRPRKTSIPANAAPATPAVRKHSNVQSANTPVISPAPTPRANASRQGTPGVVAAQSQPQATVGAVGKPVTPGCKGAGREDDPIMVDDDD